MSRDKNALCHCHKCRVFDNQQIFSVCLVFFCRLEFPYAISDSTFHLTALLIFHFRDLQDLEQVEFGQVEP